MTKLSPAAKALLTAATQRIYCLDPEDVPTSVSEYTCVIAAALREAVNKAIKPDPIMGINCIIYARDLLSIANDLDPITFPTNPMTDKPQSGQISLADVSESGFFPIPKKEYYRLRPKADATADDIMEILAFLDIGVSEEKLASMSESLRRHFESDPS